MRRYQETMKRLCSLAFTLVNHSLQATEGFSQGCGANPLCTMNRKVSKGLCASHLSRGVYQDYDPTRSMTFVARLLHLISNCRLDLTMRKSVGGWFWVPALAVGTLALHSGCGGSKDAAHRTSTSQPASRTDTKTEATAAGKETNLALSPRAASFFVEPRTCEIELGEPGVQFVARLVTKGWPGRDLTREVAWSVSPAGSATIEPGGYLKPLKAGPLAVRASLGDESYEYAVKVVDPGSAIDFSEDVVPLLTRAGCNTGGCHGRADGQNGFHLSLFGYDAEGDYRALTREAGARRLDLVDPERSLFLQKASGQVSHGGGKRIDKSSDEYKLLLGWLKTGTPGGTARLTGQWLRSRSTLGQSNFANQARFKFASPQCTPTATSATSRGLPLTACSTTRR